VFSRDVDVEGQWYEGDRGGRDGRFSGSLANCDIQ
jgi:hypothetical protein